MRLYIIRHADPDYDNNTITAEGHREAAALSYYLKEEGLTRLFTSPMGRAKDTARYTEQATALCATEQAWMKELHLFIPSGDPRVHAAWDAHGERLRTEYPKEAAAACLEKGFMAHPEIRAEQARIAEGSDQFLESLGYRREGERYRILAPSRERVGVFCHGGMGLTWLAHLLGIPLVTMWAGFFLAPSSVSVVLMDERSPQWATPRCLAMGQTAHLYAESLPIQPRGIIANFD